MSSDPITEESHIKAEKTDETTPKDLKIEEATPNADESIDSAQEDAKDLCKLDENCIPPPPQPQHEEEVIKKKYGGLMPKKPPLISKDHEHAFFDSADWALAKQKSKKGPLESLRPKLQRSPHHPARTRSLYAPSDDEEDGHNSNDADENKEDHLDSKRDSLANHQN